jgi:hypothetical protein
VANGGTARFGIQGKNRSYWSCSTTNITDRRRNGRSPQTQRLEYLVHALPKSGGGGSVHGIGRH